MQIFKNKLFRKKITAATLLLVTVVMYAPQSTAWLATAAIWSKTLHLLAGDIGGAGNLNGTGNAALFDDPMGLVADASGNIFVVDDNHAIRKITSGAVVTTFAGSSLEIGSTDGASSTARFSFLPGIAQDSSGNIYVADGSTIRKVTTAGVVTTLAGIAESHDSVDGTGSAARLYYPRGIAVDIAGNIYFAETYKQVIRKITSGGVVTTFAGMVDVDGFANGTGSAARFNYPEGVAVDAAGNVYVVDTGNNIIRKITSGAVVTTFAGDGADDSDDGVSGTASFSYPIGIVAGSSGNLYVTDTDNSTVRKITSGGVVTTFAGAADQDGTTDGVSSTARFDNPKGITIDALGNLYVAESSMGTIRKITSGGVVSTFAGRIQQTGFTDGTGSAARFSYLGSLAANASGTIYVADNGNALIRKITPAGVVTTFAGTAGNFDCTDGTGSAASFNNIQGIVVAPSGDIYVSDVNCRTIRKITIAGVVTTFAGSGNWGYADANGISAEFAGPRDMAMDSSGNLYVADQFNNRIRKITPAGDVTTYAGDGSYGATDGPAASASFRTVVGVAIDAAGNLYLGDANNLTIRKITPGGTVSTLAGLAQTSGYVDATGSAARFNDVQSIAADPAGNIYVADNNEKVIRKVTPAGVVTTVLGTASEYGIKLGLLSNARLSRPQGIALVGSRMYISTEAAILWAPK